MANEYLKRTPTSSGNRKVFTWSGWVKKQQFAYEMLSFSGPSTITTGLVMFGWGDTTGLYLNFYSGSTSRVYEVDEDYRDFGSWLHYQISVDTTQTTEDDRINFYINGVQRSLSVVSGYAALPQDYLLDNMTAGKQTLLGTGRNSSGNLSGYSKLELSDIFFVDGQTLTPEVFGFYKDGNGYISAGSTQATDFRNGQWVPRKPSNIIQEINDNGGFGVNGFYLPMNDSSNFGADFHCPPNSIIKLKGENLPQPRNGAPETTDAYVSQLRTDPYAANLVLAVPGIGTLRGTETVSNGNFSDGTTTGWTSNRSATITNNNGVMRVTNGASTTSGAHYPITTEIGKYYNLTFDVLTGANNAYIGVTDSNLYASGTFAYGYQILTNGSYSIIFQATASQEILHFHVYGGSSGSFKEFDNVSVREVNVPLDYSADIKGSGTNKTLTANGNAGVGYEIPSYYGSALSFGNDGTNGAGNTDVINVPTSSDFVFTGDVTMEGWIYPTGTPSTAACFIGQWLSGGGTDRNMQINFDTSNRVIAYFNSSATNYDTGTSSALALDQWHHIAAEKHGSNFTLYVNGVAVGVNANTPTAGNTSTVPFTIGSESDGSNGADYGFNGYIQDVRVYKGVAKYKGGFDVPKPYTPVNFASWRAVPDTCQNNFATWNPLDVYQNAGAGGPAPLSSGNLITGSTDNKSTHSNFGVTSGKWYYESMFSQGINNSDGLGVVAQYEKGYNGTSNGGYYILYRDNGGLFIGNGTSRYDPPAGTYRSWGPYDVISVGIDNREVIFFNKGIEELRYPFPSHVADGAVWMPALLNRQAGYIYTNFGQNPTFSGNTTPGTFTDSNGKGLFKYQPPEGFLALCEDNLPRPVIEDPGEHFKTVLYTGSSVSGSEKGRSISGLGFKPDLVWLKSRSIVQNHQLYDSVRGFGGGKGLSSDENRVEGDIGGYPDQTYGFVSSADDNGFSVLATHSTGSWVNDTGVTYVAWCWKAGGEAVTNTDGSITSQVSVNQDVGFSIVSYTGNNTDGATIGHGLGKKPSMIIVKERNGTSGWFVYHKFPGATKYLTLNATTGITTETGAGSWFHGTEPTSSVFTVGANGATNENNMPIIAYCWAEIEGFSKFGSYVGNASTDGPFVYCGFKPAWILYKRADDASNWAIRDSSRESTNPSVASLYPSQYNSEDWTGGSGYYIDFLSNGFKIRGNGSGINASGGTFIFAAFAESPFKYSNSK
jgi:hypothetical protein